MTFKAYIDNIQAKTGKTPKDFRQMAEQKGFVEGGAIKKGVKAGQIVDWLKTDFDLGRGHAMAVYALLKGHKDSREVAARDSRTKGRR
jgi:uncharacterized protein DUF4287